jgi:uncharacterized protein
MSYSNSLIHETSPYLLQHAHNPVNWVPFNSSAFEQAKSENKLVLISVGYSACHWCHVMEHESFEDEQVARIMNEHFICIKVDREERPDVDMLYMQAVQLMTGQGGWPLNCFTLPDGRPIYGGTYFNKQQWMGLLNNLQVLHQKNPAKVEEYAKELTEGLNQSEHIVQSDKYEGEILPAVLDKMVQKWQTGFDMVHGGPNRSPKFPLPSNYLFLLRFAHISNNDFILKHVHLTLLKMADSGLYDQLHGGFARYSTDVLWKVPHFEKMLYDNAQLVSLYAEAYQASKQERYLEIVNETLAFIEREWMGTEGQFYSALDADSEGEEGKYYVWKKEELEDSLGEDASLFFDAFGINEKGYWEHGNYILMREENTAALLFQHQLTAKECKAKLEACRVKLREVAATRIKPGLDDKTITSWQALTIKAFVDGYLVTGNKHYLMIAEKSMQFLISALRSQDGGLLRTYKNGQSKINGFLDDYAFTIEALITLYKATAQEDYLTKAEFLTEYVWSQFSNPESVFFYYTHQNDKELLLRNTEVSDNVIPASNSQMARNLWELSHYFYRPVYEERAKKMLRATVSDMERYGPGYSNWATLGLQLTYPFHEIAIVGKTVDEKVLEWHQHYHPNTILAVARNVSDLALVKGRYVEGKTLLYVCYQHTCNLPVESVKAATLQIEKKGL